MTTIDPHVGAPGPMVGHVVAASDGAARPQPAALAWLTATDHKKIGRLFIGASLLVLLGIAAVGAVLGLERIDATGDLIDAGALPQLFSIFRLGLVFSVLVPFALGVAIAVVPLQLGARALAFPRLASAGFWAWLAGSGLVLGSIAANGGPGGGSSSAVELSLAGHIVLCLGLSAAAVSLAASVLTTRAPGMNMRRVPVFSWSALVGALGLLAVLPVLMGTLVLLIVDYRYARSAFGGNQGIWEWIGFSVTQPATLLFAVPAFGLLAETVATSTGRRLQGRGIVFAGIGLVGVAAIGGVTQSSFPLRTNLLDAGLGDIISDLAPFALFNLVPLLGGTVVLATVLLALKAARPRTALAPLTFALLGVLLVLAGMAGNALAHVGDAGLAGTVFEEGVWIAVTYGTVLALLGGVAYWGPKLWGRTIDDRKALPLALLGALATALASLPYLIAGFADQPAMSTRFDYEGPQALWNVAVTAGHALMALTVLAFAGLAVTSFRKGELAGDDPWNGQTLEWATTSPAPADNFAELHVISSPHPLLDLSAGSGEAQGSAR